jgi:hypothetical protein
MGIREGEQGTVPNPWPFAKALGLSETSDPRTMGAIYGVEVFTY